MNPANVINNCINQQKFLTESWGKVRCRNLNDAIAFIQKFYFVNLTQLLLSYEIDIFLLSVYRPTWVHKFIYRDTNETCNPLLPFIQSNRLICKKYKDVEDQLATLYLDLLQYFQAVIPIHPVLCPALFPSSDKREYHYADWHKIDYVKPQDVLFHEVTRNWPNHWFIQHHIINNNNNNNNQNDNNNNNNNNNNQNNNSNNNNNNQNNNNNELLPTTERWTCQNCTFINQMKLNHYSCQICGAPNLKYMKPHKK